MVDSVVRGVYKKLHLDANNESFSLAAKILYKSYGKHKADKFGEFEMSYIYLCRSNKKEIKFKPDEKYVS